MRRLQLSVRTSSVKYHSVSAELWRGMCAEGSAVGDAHPLLELLDDRLGNVRVEVGYWWIVS